MGRVQRLRGSEVLVLVLVEAKSGEIEYELKRKNGDVGLEHMSVSEGVWDVEGRQMERKHLVRSRRG